MGQLANAQTYLYTEGQSWEKSSSAGGWETQYFGSRESGRKENEAAGEQGFPAGGRAAMAQALQGQ